MGQEEKKGRRGRRGEVKGGVVFESYDALLSIYVSVLSED